MGTSNIECQKDKFTMDFGDKNLQQDNSPLQTAAGSIQVVICDDCPTIRSGLDHILSAAPDMEVVLNTASHDEVLSKSDELDIDVVLVDIEDKKPSGFEYLTRFREKLADAKIIVFTDCEDSKQIVEAIEMGIEGYQCKQDADADEILDSIRIVHEGGRDLAPCVTDALLLEMQSDKAMAQTKLSLREKEVLDLIAKGNTNKDIGNKLFISVRTVKFHVSSILSKLDVENRTQAALWLL